MGSETGLLKQAKASLQSMTGFTDKHHPPKKVRHTKGTPQGGVISPLLANIYLHWLDKRFHGSDGSARFAGAEMVRYADDFVILARYQGDRIRDWVEATVEDWMGLEINRGKTKVVRLQESAVREIRMLRLMRGAWGVPWLLFYW